MASYEASVKKALSSQRDLKHHKEHCSADPKSSRRLDAPLDIRFGSSAMTLSTDCTRLAKPAREPDNIARMGEAGRKRTPHKR